MGLGAAVAGSARHAGVLWCCGSALRRGAGGGEPEADHGGQDGGVADVPAGALDACQLREQVLLPDVGLGGVVVGELDGVLCDVADEQRVVVREVVLQFGRSAAPVLGHEVEVELLDAVERVEPAVQRAEVLEGTAAEQLEGQVEPGPLATVVRVVRRGVAVGHAGELVVELLVPGVVDPRRHGDDQVEVVAVAAEVRGRRALGELARVVGDERSQLTRGGPEEVDLAGLRALGERADGVVQEGQGVHSWTPLSVLCVPPKHTLGVSSLSEIQDEALMFKKHKSPTLYLRYLFVKLRKNDAFKHIYYIIFIDYKSISLQRCTVAKILATHTALKTAYLQFEPSVELLEAWK